MVSLWDVLDRARNGEKVLEKDFDMAIFRKVQELNKEYKIKYNPATPIPSDDQMADRLFEAGLRLYLELGSYCTNTGRVIKFTEQEIKEALVAAPSELVLGEGNDAVKMVHRDVEGEQEPIVCAGIQTALYSDKKMAFKIYKGCAKDRCVDGIWGGILSKIEDKYEVIAGTPSEIYGYRCATEILREAIIAAGRPGMFIVNNAPTSIATIALHDRQKGLRPCDLFETTGISELKINFDDLNRSAWGEIHNAALHGAHNSVIGGFSGTIEGAAIVSVAGAFQLLLVNRANNIRPGSIPFKTKSRATREHIWVANMALQALSRNTHLILDGSIGDHPAAGPGTRQYFIETAAGHIASTVAGGHSLGGTRKFVIGQTENFGTPLESRWMGEVCKAAVGLTRSQANEIANKLLAEYENHFEDAPFGYTYEQLFDVDKEEPLPGYLSLYEQIKEEFKALGLRFKNY
ncbi:monomethylamine:corrinoid methyltransferase [Neomoorella humiferrea]|uniref:monomethylamine:corrinoid methyltransferase n=1 Tax=Neomoorella humiferrea TaxID=676965 RepID=UPI003D93D051